MDVLDHIEQEHGNFRKKIASIEAATGDSKKRIFRELYAEIHGHHEAEEEVIFRLIKEKEDVKALEVVLEMIEEHSLASYQFSVLEKTSVENETWDAKFSVLHEVLDHHMEEEEEEFLPKAREIISEETLVKILDKFETVHEEKEKEQKKKLSH